jgi:hypothetical protein
VRSRRGEKLQNSRGFPLGAFVELWMNDATPARHPGCDWDPALVRRDQGSRDDQKAVYGVLGLDPPNRGDPPTATRRSEPLNIMNSLSRAFRECAAAMGIWCVAGPTCRILHSKYSERRLRAPRFWKTMCSTLIQYGMRASWLAASRRLQRDTGSEGNDVLGSLLIGGPLRL